MNEFKQEFTGLYTLHPEKNKLKQKIHRSWRESTREGAEHKYIASLAEKGEASVLRNFHESDFPSW